MKSAPRWRRRVEITLWVVGLSLLGVALGATFFRWQYQARQERAIDQAMDAYQIASRSTIPERSSDTPETREELPPFEEPPEPELAADPAPAPAEPAPARTVEKIEERAPPPSRPDPKRAEPESIEEAMNLDPGLMGRLEIPRLRFSAVVREGEDESVLSRAVGFLADTAKPGEGGNTALAAHRDSLFRPLKDIRVDDTIRLVIPPNTYEYRVDSLRVVKPQEVSVLDSTGTEELTLVTCYPFRYIGPAPDRFIVKATRVN